MNLQFSFSVKNELIYVENELYTQPIGSLLRQLTDADWLSIEDQLLSEFTADKYDSTLFAEYKSFLNEQITHPAIKRILDSTDSIKEFVWIVNKLDAGSKVITHILEFLVDEEQHSYEDCLFHIINSEDNEVLKNYFTSLGCAKMLPLIERNKPLYHTGKDFPFLFETDDVMSLAFQELQFICSNHFYIRKCALCKKFIWTRKMNKIYCDRPLTNMEKTCAQVGPTRLWADNNSKAYSLYWSYRRRLFNRVPNEINSYCYQQWINQTEPYKELARKNEISLLDMKNILDRLEAKIYKKAKFELKSGFKTDLDPHKDTQNHVSDNIGQQDKRLAPGRVYYSKSNVSRTIRIKKHDEKNPDWSAQDISNQQDTGMLQSNLT